MQGEKANMGKRKKMTPEEPARKKRGPPFRGDVGRTIPITVKLSRDEIRAWTVLAKKQKTTLGRLLGKTIRENIEVG